MTCLIILIFLNGMLGVNTEHPTSAFFQSRLKMETRLC